MDEPSKRAPDSIPSPDAEEKVELGSDYLDAIDRVESLPQNRSGEDKTWVWEVIERDRRHFERAMRI